MKLAGCLLACTLALSAPSSLARQISEGVYGQTSVSHVDGECGGCELRIRKVTPHIIELTASNGWSGFAYYVPREDRYRGSFEWWAGEGGPHDGVLFTLDLRFDGRTLTMNANAQQSSTQPLKFVATYRKSTPGPREIAL